MQCSGNANLVIRLRLWFSENGKRMNGFLKTEKELVRWSQILQLN